MCSAGVAVVEMQLRRSILTFWDLEAFLSVITRKEVGRDIRCGPQAPGKASVLSSGGSVACIPSLDSMCKHVSCRIC